LSKLTDQVNYQVQEATEFSRSAHVTSYQGRLALEETTKVMLTLRDEINVSADQLTELQRISSANSRLFLLHTYKRDMGDAVHDLSVPIYVKGRHWGCLRVGFKTKGQELQN